MLVVLDGKTLVSLLVKMSQTAGMVVSVVPHRVRTTDPSHEAAHLPVDQRSQDKVIVIGHQLVAVELDIVDLESFMQNLLEGDVVFVFLENRGSKVSTVQGVVKPSRLVGTR